MVKLSSSLTPPPPEDGENVGQDKEEEITYQLPPQQNRLDLKYIWLVRKKREK